jgi:hypothetical protein
VTLAVGSGASGVLAAMLVAREPDGRLFFSAVDALAFLLRGLWCTWISSPGGGLRALFQVFGDLTLRDTVRPVLVRDVVSWTALLDLYMLNWVTSRELDVFLKQRLRGTRSPGVL